MPNRARVQPLSPAAQRCRRRFLSFYPGGFRDSDYIELERSYKWTAHERWMEKLAPAPFRRLLAQAAFEEIAQHAVRIESRTNLLFSFEKMALRDAVREPSGARGFARGLYAWLHGRGTHEERFEQWVDCVGSLPRRQTRVLTWPLVTVFGFIARPESHCFLKPNVTRRAAKAYEFPFDYASRPSWHTYRGLLDFAETVRRDQRDLEPRDFIDLQGFIWVMGSDEYD
jgi:hypothetical protein